MGFENIAMNNGWSQAFVGATIVMTGLVILALAISQIHKLVNFWENRGKKSEAAEGRATAADDKRVSVPKQCPADITETAALYQPLVDRLSATFELKDLYRQAVEFDLPHPHITIRCLREAGILQSQGEGMFRWNR
jgi:hypothetical protein